MILRREACIFFFPCHSLRRMEISSILFAPCNTVVFCPFPLPPIERLAENTNPNIASKEIQQYIFFFFF